MLNLNVNLIINFYYKEKYKLKEENEIKSKDLEQQLIEKFDNNKEVKKQKNLSSNDHNSDDNYNTVKSNANLLVQETNESKFQALKTENEDSLEKIKIVDQNQDYEENIKSNDVKQENNSLLNKKENIHSDSIEKNKKEDALEVADIKLNENLEFSDFDFKDQNQIDDI